MVIYLSFPLISIFNRFKEKNQNIIKNINYDLINGRMFVVPEAFAQGF